MTKKLGYILGKLITNSSGHPGPHIAHLERLTQGKSFSLRFGKKDRLWLSGADFYKFLFRL
jgi:hypothetical protein